ncbi:MAG TPA: tRNA lysidine(34) synthetase TilS [Bacteroidota bacterium]
MPAPSLLSRFAEFSRAFNLLAPGDRLLLAVSGGVDSMVMLDLVQKLKTEWGLDVSVVHVNHQLRGRESTEDEAFVREAARSCQVPFYCKRVDTIGLKTTLGVSKQVAARQARYQYFEEIRKATSSGRVATAHHADDNAETVLLNALRGGGVRGLAGIPRARDAGHLVRPLLFARRVELLSYAREQGVRYRDDSSNATVAYTRNYLRHRVVPFLNKEMGTDFADSLNRLSNAAKRFSHLLDLLVDEQWRRIVSRRGDSYSLLLSAFTSVPVFLRKEIVVRTLREMAIEPTVVKVDEILGLCGAQSGHSISLAGEVVAVKDYGHLIFAKRPESNDFSINVAVGATYSLQEFTFTLDSPCPVPASYNGAGTTEYIDADVIREPLTLRTWRRGDWFVPIGMIGRKKLSDFFNDQKISTPDRFRIPLLQSGNDIVWVCGKRLDDRFKITKRTRRAIKLSYSPTINPAN